MTTDKSYPFRVFVSYSHEDRKLALKVVETLQAMGLEPVWDKDIRPGTAFSDAIRELIAHAHVFMPLITKNSQKRPWVHQETGYAIALNVPVLPVAIGNLPGEMIAQLQAVSVREDLAELEDRLKEVSLEQLTSLSSARPQGTVEVAYWLETRAEMIVQYANRLRDRGVFGHVRQRAHLSSFALPDKSLNDPVWQRGSVAPSSYHHHLLREERRALEAHARVRGCSLIVDPTIDFDRSVLSASVARRDRLLTLRDFLATVPDDKVRIVMTDRAREGNLTIVGDWFVAEAMVPGAGERYRQTVFSWHAPTVLRAVRLFDQEFEELCREKGLEPQATRQVAIKTIREIPTSLPPGEEAGPESPPESTRIETFPVMHKGQAAG